MLREETVEPATLELLKKLVSLPELSKFRLVRGTALSLLYGHRKSIDLDLFTDNRLDKESILSALELNFENFRIFSNRIPSILQCYVENVKVYFVSVRDPFLYPPTVTSNIPLADKRDLIALKLNAVKGRGVKKDFWDVAKLLDFYSFEELFQFYRDRYPSDDTFAIVRSVVYFDDAENDIDPEAIEKINWKQVKQKITKAFDIYFSKRI